MVIYPAWQLCEAIQMLAELDFVAETETLNGLAKFDVSDEKYKGVILGRLRYIRQHCELIELVTADRYIQRKIADFERSATPSELQHEAKTIRELIRVDLWERRFTYIPMDKAKTLLDLDQNWAVVWLKFPNEVEIDSREAVECYSLGRNTACVFHLMRVVEFGMRSLAASLKVKNIKSGKQGKAMTPIAWAEWQTIIEAMEQALANMSNMKRGAKKAADQAFYHRAMLDLRSFKDAFRNHVMHARVSYDEHQAMSIMNHTRAFMTSIATRAVK